MRLPSSSKFRCLYLQARILERNMENRVTTWKLSNWYIWSDTLPKSCIHLVDFVLDGKTEVGLLTKTYSNDKRFSICWPTNVKRECNLLKRLLLQVEFSLDYFWAITAPFAGSLMLTCSRHVGSFHLATSDTILENDLLSQTSFNKLPPLLNANSILVNGCSTCGIAYFNIQQYMIRCSSLWSTLLEPLLA